MYFKIMNVFCLTKIQRKINTKNRYKENMTILFLTFITCTSLCASRFILCLKCLRTRHITTSVSRYGTTHVPHEKHGTTCTTLCGTKVNYIDFKKMVPHFVPHFLYCATCATFCGTFCGTKESV